MRAKEFIIEGMTFSAAVEKPYTTQSGKKTTYWTDEDWRKKVEKPCYACNGSGKNPYYKEETCEYCRGTGKYFDDVSDAPELSVSNANGFAIQEMLGVEPDYGGIIYNKDLPELIRKLMYIKNKSLEKYAVEPSITGGKMKRIDDPETNVTTIGKTATMYDMGRSTEQVERYIDKLLEIAKFAQENNASLSWA